MVWQLQEAKNKFSALVNKVLTEGPQYVSKHGKKTVVVISCDEYEKLTNSNKSFVDFLLSAPKVELDITRDSQEARDIEL